MARLTNKKPAVEDARKLTGPEKAAVILLSLGEDHTRLWQGLDEDEIKEISQAMASLGTVSAQVVEELLIEFVSGMTGSGSVMGSFEQTQRLLAAFMPSDRVEGLMEEIRGPAGRTMWDKLGNVNEAVLANYLKNEYPQTVAVVLSKVKPDHAARVLTSLPEDFALECVQRMLRMEPVQREILDKIEQTLRNEFMSNLARTSKRDSHEMMADIFNSFDRQTEARFIGALEERNREAAERIRALMFVFEDLAKLDPGGIQTLLRAVEKDSSAWPSRARRNPCANCSSPTCPSAPPRSCARTWSPWARSASRTSIRPRWPWSRSPRISPPRAKSCWSARAAMMS